jgi:hypothetical protein
MFDTSKHSIRAGRLSRLSDSRSSSSASTRLRRFCSVADASCSSARLAPLRRPDLDPRAPEIAEERRERLGVHDVWRHDDLRRDRGRAPVVLDAE